MPGLPAVRDAPVPRALPAARAPRRLLTEGFNTVSLYVPLVRARQGDPSIELSSGHPRAPCATACRGKLRCGDVLKVVTGLIYLLSRRIDFQMQVSFCKLRHVVPAAIVATNAQKCGVVYYPTSTDEESPLSPTKPTPLARGSPLFCLAADGGVGIVCGYRGSPASQRRCACGKALLKLGPKFPPKQLEDPQLLQALRFKRGHWCVGIANRVS